MAAAITIFTLYTLFTKYKLWDKLPQFVKNCVPVGAVFHLLVYASTRIFYNKETPINETAYILAYEFTKGEQEIHDLVLQHYTIICDQFIKIT